MKVQKLRLKNFKRFESLELNFMDPVEGEAEPLILIQGGNGSGKSSVLQVISAMLGVATGALKKMDDLIWPGFDLGKAGTVWTNPTEIELEVAFSNEELETTREVWNRLAPYKPELEICPSMEPVVVIRLKGNKVIADQPGQLFQFRGRNYFQQLPEHERRNLTFDKIGRALWYHVLREPISIFNGKKQKQAPSTGFDAVTNFEDERAFRQKLVELFVYHQSLKQPTSQRDFYIEIQEAFQKIFPERRFEGIRVDGSPGMNMETTFYLHDGTHPYEVSEMSGGERAVLPLLIDFINWRINRSIVLIDEVELHLNPMQQQNLVFGLKKLGKHNQIIMTTHSEQVHNIVNKRQVRQLPRN